MGNPASTLLCTAALLGLGSGACEVRPDGGEYTDYVHFSSYQLAREVVIGAEAGWAREAALRLAPRLELQLGRPVRVVELDAARPSAQRLRMLIASPEAPALRGVLERLAAENPALVEFGSAPDPRGAALIATLADPLRASSPLSICVAQPGSELVDPGLDLDLAATLAPTWQTGWQLFSGGELVATSADAAGATRPARPELRTAAEWAAAEPGLAWLAAGDRAARSGVEDLLGPAPREVGELRVRLWEHPVDLARDAGGFARWIARPAAGVLELARDCSPLEARRGFAELYARAGWGEPREAWLAEGLGVHVAGAWWGRDLERWCARLARDELVLDAQRLAGDADASPHQLGPLRGLLVGVLAATGGDGAVRRAWSEGGPALTPELRAAFEGRLARLGERHAHELAIEAHHQRVAVRSRPFRHGVNLVAAGPDPSLPSAGFGSRDAASRLGELAALGADSVAFDWAMVVEPAAPRLAYQRRAPRGSQADDLALEGGAQVAAELGLDLLLKPHLWLADSGTFAGWTLVHSREELQRFFEAERRLALHYGLVSELIGAEILVLAAEQRDASVTREDRGDPFWSPEHFRWKLERWREVIAAARAAFDGGLTYAAHWDDERDGITFWRELDFVGLDLFAPFPVPDDPKSPPLDLQAVRNNLAFSIAQAKRGASWNGKRLLICELGFPATSGNWSNPEIPAGPADAQLQADLLGALADVLEEESAQPVGMAGLFLWNSSCDAGAGAPDQRGYSLDGELARPALQRVLALP